jgi:hypothetical protein
MHYFHIIIIGSVLISITNCFNIFGIDEINKDSILSLQDDDIVIQRVNANILNNIFFILFINIKPRRLMHE